MTTQHGPDLVDKIRSSIDIVSVVSESVALKKSGRKYRGLCPFHNEKTPSFYVDELKQLFYCFGCATGGDTFKFVMLREGVGFPEALRLLARRAGIVVPASDGSSGRTSEREALLAACKDASLVYAKILKERAEGEPGRAYLEQRGVSAEIADELGLGFAPDSWDTLRDELPGQGHRPQVLLAAGLLGRNDRGGYFDRFRNRIIFPIINLSGDVIGFGGRDIADGQPKYLNSQETLVYNKRENLYGLFQSRHVIKEKGEAIIVEGYLDYVALYQAGVRNVAATLGTSFTDEQAGLLRRFTEKVVLNYDTDSAGESATKRSLEKLLAQGLGVRVLQLPSGKDPDAFLRSSSAEAYRGHLDQAPNGFDFLVSSASAGHDLGNPSEVAAAAREIVPVLAKIPSRVERSRYVGMLADKLRVDDGVLLAEIRDALLRDAKSSARAASAERPAAPRTEAARPVREAEARLLRALVEVETCRSRLLHEILPADLEDAMTASIIGRIADLESRGREISYGELTGTLPDRERDLLAKIAMRGDPPPDMREAEHCLQTLRRFRLIKERNGVQKEMEGAPDRTRLEELMRKKIDLSRQIDALS